MYTIELAATDQSLTNLSILKIAFQSTNVTIPMGKYMDKHSFTC